MYVLLAFALTVAVIALAWHGVGIAHRSDDEATRGGQSPSPRSRRPERPAEKPRRTRVIAPDDDPEFLSEIARKLREDGKQS